MLVDNIEHGKKVMRSLYKRMQKSGEYDFSIDTETKPKAPYNGKRDALIIGRMEIIIFSICYRGVSYSFPTDRFLGAYPSMEEWAEVLRPYAENPEITKVMHNANYDLCTFITSTSLTEWNNVHCTMIGGWLAREYVDKSLKERAPFYGRYIQKTATINFSDLKDLSTYAETDVIVTDELYQMQRYGRIKRPYDLRFCKPNGKLLVEPNGFLKNKRTAGREVSLSMIEGEALDDFKRMYLAVQEFPVLRSNVRAEVLGFPIDRKALIAGRNKLMEALDSAIKKIYRIAGRSFNINSTQQLTEVMLELGIESPMKTGTGAPSFAAKALVKLAGTHEIIDRIGSYKGLEKLKSNYLGDHDKKKGILEYVDPDDILHCTVNSVGAVTGRASSSNPNGQNIPSRKDVYGIKDCFVSTNKYPTVSRRRLQRLGEKSPKSALATISRLPQEKRQVLLCLDYSQLEIRVMALYCKDERMTEVLCDPKGDIHQTTADHFGVPRNPAAKNLNFLLLYGGQEYMLSEALTFMGVPTSKQVAAGYIRQHTITYPGVLRYRQELLARYKKDGFVRYFTGRTRTLEHSVDWNNKYSVHKAETTLSNNVVQGAGQDFLKATIARVDYRGVHPDRLMLSDYKAFTSENPTHYDMVEELAGEVDKVRETFKRWKCRYLLQVHDEVIFTVDARGAEECLIMLGDTMCMPHYLPGTTNYSVPLAAEGGIGLTWKQAKGKGAFKFYEARMKDKYLNI